MTTNNPKIIVALDFNSKPQCLALVSQLDSALCRLKIGKEMFTLFGPTLVEELQGLGFEVFLDLKFHDIPTTVKKAVAAAASLGVWMVNVHASGGQRMLEAAGEALADIQQPPKLIAVTVLTSMEAEDLQQIGINTSPKIHAENLAQLAKNSGLDGVVCSAQEASSIKTLCGSNFTCVTPGIRLSDASSDDQRRIMTPIKALESGSDYLVIGRPITQASDPLNALQNIHESIKHFKAS